jgi:hypothetical protein
MRYGVPHTIRMPHNQPTDVPSAIVFERSLVEEISPTTTCVTGPHVAPYEKINKETKATRHFATASLPGAATATIANNNIDRPHTREPPMRLFLRPVYLISRKDVREPAIPHTPVTIVVIKGLSMPDILKKNVP